MPRLTEQIVELEIFTTAFDLAERLYGEISHEMIELNSLGNLRKLSFSDERLDEIMYFGIFMDRWGPEEPPYWLSFFEELNKAGVKLRLSHLGLLGLLDEISDELTELLCNSVDLDNLEMLHLENSTYGDISQSEFTFLETITKHTPSLKSLAITKGEDVHDSLLEEVVLNKTHRPRFMESLSNTLVKNIPHQLEEFYISNFQPKDEAERENFQSSILSSQRNLVRLTFRSRFVGGLFRRDDGGRISICNDWNNERKLRRYCPRILGHFHSRPYMCSDHIVSIRCRRLYFQQFFKRDLIYTGAKIHLPLLEQYYNEFVFVNPQCGKVYLNEEMMPLY